MRRFAQHATALLFTLSFVGSTAASDWRDTALTQTDMNIGAAEEYAEADKQLNLVYKELLGQLEGEEKQQLIAAQLAWIAFRDAEVEFQASGWQGGSMYSMVYSEELTGLTKRRVNDLIDELAERESY